MSNNIAVVRLEFKEPNGNTVFDNGSYIWNINYSYKGVIRCISVPVFRTCEPMFENEVSYHKKIYKLMQNKRKVRKDIVRAIVKDYVSVIRDMTNEEIIEGIKGSLLGNENLRNITIELK